MQLFYHSKYIIQNLSLLIMPRLTTYAHKKLKKAVTRINKKMRKTKK